MSNLLLTRNDDWRLNSSFFQNYDWISIARYGAVGSFVLSPGTLQESSSLKLPSLHSFFKKSPFFFSFVRLVPVARWPISCPYRHRHRQEGPPRLGCARNASLLLLLPR